MKKQLLTLLITIMVVIFLITACSSSSSTNTTAPSTNTQDGSTLLQKRCTVCHNLTRVESKKLTSAEWEAIVDRMIGKGAKLSADEKILVIDYLAATYGK